MNAKFSYTYFGNRLRHDRILKLFTDGLDRCGIILRPFYLVQEGDSISIQQSHDKAAEFELSYLDYRCMREIAEIPGRYTSEHELIKRLDAGMLCIALLKDGRCVAFNWVDLNQCNFAGYLFSLNTDEAYLFDAWTLVEARGQSVATILRTKTYSELSKYKKSKFYSVTECVNSSAIKFKKKLHAQNLQLLLYINVFERVKKTFSIKKYDNEICTAIANRQL